MEEKQQLINRLRAILIESNISMADAGPLAKAVIEAAYDKAGFSTTISNIVLISEALSEFAYAI